MARNRLFFDTSVCTRIAYHKPEKEESFIRRYIDATYEYVVSPLTLLELLIKIGRGNEEYFEKNRKSLRVLAADPEKLIFLDFPGSHLLRHIFGLLPTVKFGPEEFRSWIQVVLSASSLDDSVRGNVDLGDKERLFGLDFNLIDAQLQEGKDDHRLILEGIRDGSNHHVDVLAWASETLTELGREPNSEDCKKAAHALEAAYLFDVYLWKQAKNQTYDFGRHDTDWIDRQQLFYLSDSQVLFITEDVNLLQETRKSSQAARIQNLDALLREAK